MMIVKHTDNTGLVAKHSLISPTVKLFEKTCIQKRIKNYYTHIVYTHHNHVNIKKKKLIELKFYINNMWRPTQQQMKVV